MRIFLTGATGAAGRPTALRLVADGHDVVAAASAPERAAAVQALGATPVVIDLFDPQTVERAVAGADAVVNLATRIPPLSRAALPGAWSDNDRLRREAAPNLAAAAIATGARLIQESIAFVYEDGGDAWLDEDTAVDRPATMAAAADAERAAASVTEQGGVGIALRFANFYGAGTSHTDAAVALARRGVSMFAGARAGYWTFLHVDDVAGAVAAALGAPPGVYNVAEDDPITRGEWAEVVGRALGRKVRVPPGGLLAAAGSGARALARSSRISNRRFREATGWAPIRSSARDGWPAVVAASAEVVDA